MEELMSESLMLDMGLQGIKDGSEQEKRIKAFLSEQKGVELPTSLLSSSELEWLHKSSETYEGKIIILDFFTYCCINCIHAMPLLEALESKFPANDVVLIGVHSAKFINEKSSTNVQHALSRYGIFRPVINDHSYHLWNTFSVTCWPSILIIDRNFRLRKYFVGENFLKGIETFVNTLLDVPTNLSPKISLSTTSSHLQGLYYPGKLSVLNGKISVSDSGNHRILVFQNSKEPLIIGCGDKGFQDGSFTAARFSSPQGVLLYNENTLYVADTGNHAIREINLKEKTVSTILGTGVQGADFLGGNRMRSQSIASPWDICVGPAPSGSGEVLYIAMAGSHQIWAYGLTDSEWWKGIKREAGTGFAIAGNGREENRNNSYPHQASFAQPSGICYSKDHHALFIADSESSSIRRLNLKDGSVKNVCGGERDPTNLFAFGDLDGKGINAKLQHPLSVSLFTEGKLLVCDSYNHKLKIIENLDDKSPSCSTFKASVFSTLQEPSDVVYYDNSIYVCDSNNHEIIIYDPSNENISTLNIPLLSQKKNPSRIKEEVIKEKICFSSSSFEINFICDHQDRKIQDGKVFGQDDIISSSSRLENDKFIIQCESSASFGCVNVQLNLIVCNLVDKSCKMVLRNYILDYTVNSDSTANRVVDFKKIIV